MEEYYPDFFNDVFGPVMQPGSSSHTAGPCRIGYEAFCVLGEKPCRIEIRLDRNGSFAGTFGLMNEDLGMLAGAYGMLPDDERIFDIRDILDDEKIEYGFEKTDLKGSDHPNAVEFILTKEGEKQISLTGNSTGGGRIEIVRICGYDVSYIGDTYFTGVCIPEDSQAEMPGFFADQGTGETGMVRTEGKGVLYYKLSGDDPGELRNILEQQYAKNAEVLVFGLKPVLPVISGKKRKKQLFRSVEKWRKRAAEKKVGLAEAAVWYEEAASGMKREEILRKMDSLRRRMERQTGNVYRTEEGLLETPFSGYGFRQWREYTAKQKPISDKLISNVVRYVYGVQALQKGTCLVPGPMGTGGGFLYAALRAVCEDREIPAEAQVEGLLVAAGIGAICYSRGNPTGEVMGCMGECGVCGAMTSAAICHVCGGTPEQVENAASLTLQMSYGWPCDPVPGGDNQPCLSRFMTAAVMAVVFADLALSGRKAVIPFHEVFDAAVAYGETLPAGLKCTSRGGLCLTPEAEKRRKQFDDWFVSEEKRRSGYGRKKVQYSSDP